MNLDLTDIAAAQPLAASPILEEDWWAQEVQRHQGEAERWERRVELAERHQEFELATQAAQRARHHAGLALLARAHFAERSVEARLAAIKARQQATASAGGQ